MNAAISLCGVFCIVTASVEAARSYCRGNRRALRLLRDALRFVLFVRDAVSYHASPVKNILESYETDEAELYEFFKYAAESSLTEALKETKPPFDSITMDILTDFANRLGRGYSDSQLELCESLGAKLRAHAEELEGALKNKEKAAVAIAVFISATAILLLL